MSTTIIPALLVGPAFFAVFTLYRIAYALERIADAQDKAGQPPYQPEPKRHPFYGTELP